MRTECLGEYLDLKGKEVTLGWIKTYTEELDNLSCSPDIIRMIKSRKMRWMWYVAHIREMRMHTEFWSENLIERDHSET
jgi:hypothetical protein